MKFARPTVIHFLPIEAAAIMSLLVSLPAAAGDWPMFGGTSSRNMVSREKGGPTDWDVKTGRNIKWVADLGSTSHGTPVVSGGRVFAGTNNEGHRDPANTVDGGVEMAFDEVTGKFLWQKFYPKLPTGRVNDWPGIGICATVHRIGSALALHQHWSRHLLRHVDWRTETRRWITAGLVGFGHDRQAWRFSISPNYLLPRVLS